MTLNKTPEAINRIMFFIQKHADYYMHVEHWHGQHKMKSNDYQEWIKKVESNLKRENLITKFPEYYGLISEEQSDASDIDDLEAK